MARRCGCPWSVGCCAGGLGRRGGDFVVDWVGPPAALAEELAHRLRTAPCSMPILSDLTIDRCDLGWRLGRRRLEKAAPRGGASETALWEVVLRRAASPER